jgi:predicted TIM-barrel fold metal-dependent hydrolase
MLNDNETDCKKALNYIFEKIPANRLCYGSNYPVCNTDHYSYWYELLKNYAPEEMHDDIFYHTAKIIYF